MTYCFSTDMQDEQIIFGGEKKLKQAIQEAYDLFKPKAIGIFSTCPVGLIGDDVHAVAREMKEKLGDSTSSASVARATKGVSQSAGHHIANNGIFTHVVGLDDTVKEGKFKINLLGEYNIGGDAFEIERLFEDCGITLISTFSGNSSYDQFANSHTADLNLIMCHRSINYVAEMMETKFGIPWIKVNFIGAEATAKSLRKIAGYFDDPELTDEGRGGHRPGDAGGGGGAGRSQGPVRGQNGHALRGRLPGASLPGTLPGDRHGDHRRGLRVRPPGRLRRPAGLARPQGGRRQPQHRGTARRSRTPSRYQPRLSEADIARLEKAGIKLSEYEGMMAEMESGALVIDDISQFETERLIELYQPDIFCAGIKEKYAIQKSGVPMKQLHSYDYGGPYAGFKGAINFYREIDRMVNSKVWKYLKAPWQENPELAAKYAWE